MAHLGSHRTRRRLAGARRGQGLLRRRRHERNRTPARALAVLLAGGPGGTGWQRLALEDFRAVARYCARRRWSLGVHVVGGGGIDAVLATFAEVDAETPIGDLGFTLIHAYLEPSAENMAQATALGVLVAAQPSIHWINGASLVERLGPAATRANPIRDWLEAGVTVGAGSDGPFFPIDPRLGLWQLRTRAVAGGADPHAPELALDGMGALALYTRGAAEVAHDGRRRARLVPDALADWVAFSVDPAAAPPDAVREMTALETAVAGEIVHRMAP